MENKAEGLQSINSKVAQTAQQTAQDKIAAQEQKSNMHRGGSTLEKNAIALQL